MTPIHRVLILLGLLLTHAAPAAVFTVDVLVDDADAGDSNPGNGLCEDNFGACTLRAAIMEANALSGIDSIHFSVSGPLSLSPLQGALPTIVETLIIDGTTAPGFNSSGTTLLDAPPVITINGNQLSGSALDGLRISGVNSDTTEIYSLALVNFPDNGIELNTGADGAIIQGCNLSGNGGSGLFAVNPDFLVIGQIYGIFTQEFLGLGNLFALNGGPGLFLSGSDSNTIFGNFIGMLADGISDAGNGGDGISLIGSNNVIGFFDDNEQSGNIIANNSGHGLLVLGTNTQIYANRIGTGRLPGFYGNGGSGIRVSGSDNRIGTTGINSGNIIVNNQIGIEAGVGGGSAANLIIQNNQIGIANAGLGNAGDGIYLESGDNARILNNIVINNGGDGMELRSDDNIIRGNQIGVIGSSRHGNAEHGIFTFNAARNIIGGSNSADANIIGDNGANVAPFYHGLQLQGDDHQIIGNFIGVTPAGDNIGHPSLGLAVAGLGYQVSDNTVGFNLTGISLGGYNHTLEDNFVGTDRFGRRLGNQFDGLRLEGNAPGFNNFIGFNNTIAYNGRFGIYGNAIAGMTARYNIIGNHIIQNDNAGMALPFTGSNGSYLVQSNEVAYNGNNGIMIFGGDTTTTLSINTFYGNNGIAIDINGNGQDANDANDADAGPNQRMNYPQIQNVTFIPGPPVIARVDFQIDATTANAAYPLTVQAYWTDREEAMQGRFFDNSFTYNTPQAVATIDLTLPNFVTGGKLALLVTDNNGNSSELSPGVNFGVIELIHKDGFETFGADF
ncbi:MAG: hypothetical protein Tsb002_38120 [Wenzhouxiangellaceae bacterium]